MAVPCAVAGEDVGGHQDGACLAPGSAAGGVPRGGSGWWC